MASNVVHCSFIERHGKATEAIDRHATLLADLEADGAGRSLRIPCSGRTRLPWDVTCRGVVDGGAS